MCGVHFVIPNSLSIMDATRAPARAVEPSTLAAFLWLTQTSKTVGSESTGAY